MISAPMWSHEDEFRQHYYGYSSGCDDYECAFTIPATYGSSGSAVINEKGEIVSIISRAAISFSNYAIGAKPKDIDEFLERAYETLRR
jgi:glutathionyl-hydroquinone reductase